MSITGFPAEEFQARAHRAQTLMHHAEMDALLLTTEADLRYFSGFLTRFWESPTRPWFLLLPAHGKPVAVIPSIGEPLMKTTWIEDIRTWRSPDYLDDGTSLLASALLELVPRNGRVGVQMGRETHVRMPLSAFDDLRRALETRTMVDAAEIMRSLRQTKSEAEIASIARACSVADRAFARVEEIARADVPLSDVFRRFQMLCLEEGADMVPYLAGGAGPGGYSDVISPASARALQQGDVLMLDTGLTVGGYFCDFDRNYAIGTPSAEVADGHKRLVEATQAAFDIARPGGTVADLFSVMDRICNGGAGGSDAGRLGHGLGMQLTEPPSLIPADHTVLEPGMVLTLEPGIDLGGGRIMVHEEDIVIRETGAQWLSTPAGPEIAVIDP